jgi:hypothetical protein
VTKTGLEQAGMQPDPGFVRLEHMGRRLVVMSVLVLLVAGCGANSELPVGEPPAPGAPVWVEPGCSQWAPDLMPGEADGKRGAVPDDFVTVSVMRCRTSVRRLPDKGEWTTVVTEKAGTPAEDLVAQLRKASDRRTSEACTLEFVAPPYFVLINAEGKAVLPQVPTDACGKPRIEVRNTLDALPYKTVSETLVNQSQSQLSIDTGCSSAWKDLLAIDEISYKPGPATKVMRATGQVRVCVFQSEGDIGKLVSGHTVPAGQLTSLDSAGPAAPCEAEHTRFATLTGDSGGGDAMVELDGCHRMIRPDQTLGQLDAATVAGLAK